MSDSIIFTVPAIHCEHCERALRRELEPVEGVERIDVDLDQKRVSVTGTALDGAKLRAAIDEAGFDAAA